MRSIVAKHVNAAGVKERDDVAKLNANLAGRPLPARASPSMRSIRRRSRDKLRSAGFYTEWKGKYGEEAWAILEKSVGKLA